MDCFGTYSTHAQTCVPLQGYILGLRLFLRLLTSLNTFAYFGINFETYMQWHRSLACAHMVDATQYSLDWTCQYDLAFTYAINMFVHVQTWSMLRHVHLIEQWKLLFNNENCKCQDAQKKLEKVVKSQMLAMFIFYCKLHMKVLTTENVMLHLHGKNQAKWLFSKNPCVFTIFVIFFVKNGQH